MLVSVSYKLPHLDPISPTMFKLKSSSNSTLTLVQSQFHCISVIPRTALNAYWTQFDSEPSSEHGSNFDHFDTVSVCGSEIVPSATVKSLGVIFDSAFSMDKQVAAICKTCYFHIRAFHLVRSSLPDDVARTVACSIVQSRLDYCNSLFVGMSEANFSKLQQVQNTLARVVVRRGKFDHITPTLSELYWLPIRQRVIFKVATITFKLRQHSQPTYLSDQLQQLLLTEPTRTVLAQCSFTSATPNIWNSLPQHLRQCCDLETFRRKLKTYLFSSVYAAWAAYPRLRIAFLCYIWRVTNFIWWWWWWW